MGCAGSKEDDRTAVGGRAEAAYSDQAEDAAAMLSGAGRLLPARLFHA